jgi:hypothetical protein
MQREHSSRFFITFPQFFVGKRLLYMGQLDERISKEFAVWEQRGRGWQVWPEPVLPEPPFQEFTGYQLAPAEIIDDGRKPGLLASLFDSFKASPKPPVIIEEQEEPEPALSEHALTAEFVAALPAKNTVREEAWRAFLDSLHVCANPVAFELFAKEDRILVQLASSSHDAPALQRQLSAFVPEVPFIQTEKIAQAWTQTLGIGFIVDCGLANAFMLPLQVQQHVDPFVGLVAALSELRRDETAVFQILFQPVQHPWPTSIWNSVTDKSGKMIFSNIVPLIPGTKEKFASPLFGAVIRVAAQAESFERSAVIAQNMARALNVFARPDNNHLIPLTNDDYPFEAHEGDLLNRQSRRSGMLLNREELLGFVHLPSDDVRSPKLRRQSTRTKAAPVLSPHGILFGFNEHAGRQTEVRLSAEQRVRHTHIIGATGTGKSTLLFNLIQQDIEKGEGVAVLDPHGDLVDRILGIIPRERVNDVVLLDPTDEEFSVGFNILSAHSDFEKNLLASDLVSVFRRLSTSWGDQLNSVLNNAILAFLESSEGGTLNDLRRFLLDAEFRNRFLETVRDPDIVFYWRKAFPQLGGNKSIGPVLTRLDTFLSPKPIRYLVSQKANRLDFADMLDSGKIFLAKLPQGQLGKENSFLLGSLLVSKFQQLAMSRQRMSQEMRRDFWLYIDEFHSFITPSMAEILSGARKYRVGLILAHQELHQLQRDAEVASAIANCATRIVFRVGDSDAHALEKGFSSFIAKDLQNLATGEAIARIERSDADFNLSIPLPAELDPAQALETRKRVITASREKYATPRDEIEAALFQASKVEPAAPPKRPIEKTVEPLKVELIPEPIIEPPPQAEPSPPPVAEARKARPLPVVEGMGGPEHKATQKRIKEAAEALGFLAVIEKEIPHGSVDLALVRSGGISIACEITVTTTIHHEVGNVRKCLEAGFTQVAVIASKLQRLEQIKEAVVADLGDEKSACVGYFTPDIFIDWLKALPAVESLPVSSEPTVTMRRGRTVTRRAPTLTPQERRQKEAAHLKMISDVMRERPDSSGS